MNGVFASSQDWMRSFHWTQDVLFPRNLHNLWSNGVPFSILLVIMTTKPLFLWMPNVLSKILMHIVELCWMSRCKLPHINSSRCLCRWTWTSRSCYHWIVPVQQGNRIEICEEFPMLWILGNVHSNLIVSPPIPNCSLWPFHYSITSFVAWIFPKHNTLNRATRSLRNRECLQSPCCKILVWFSFLVSVSLALISRSWLVTRTLVLKFLLLSPCSLQRFPKLVELTSHSEYSEPILLVAFLESVKTDYLCSCAAISRSWSIFPLILHAPGSPILFLDFNNIRISSCCCRNVFNPIFVCTSLIFQIFL